MLAPGAVSAGGVLGCLVADPTKKHQTPGFLVFLWVFGGCICETGQHVPEIAHPVLAVRLHPSTGDCVSPLQNSDRSRTLPQEEQAEDLGHPAGKLSPRTAGRGAWGKAQAATLLVGLMIIYLFAHKWQQ